MSNQNKHISVLPVETIDNMLIVDGGIYVDATLGGGGHSLGLLAAAEKGTGVKELHLVVLDLDSKAWALFRTQLRDQLGKSYQGELLETNLLKVTLDTGLVVNIHFVNDNFANLEIHLNKIFSKDQLAGNLQAVVADLGLSQNQMENKSKGFSYRFDAPLDMRYLVDAQVTAADLLNGLGRKELATMFTDYGDISHAKDLVEEVIFVRKKSPIKTTKQLNEVILSARFMQPGKKRNQLMAKVYQALRIAVNLEYQNMATLIDFSYGVLPKGKKLLVITFHSGEQRLVKRIVKNLSPEPKHKLLKPSTREQKQNPRSSSAMLNVIAKV